MGLTGNPGGGDQPSPTRSDGPGLIQIDHGVPQGYRREPQLQSQFEKAAQALLVSDGWDDPVSGKKQLMADLALEGGGVKGIGLVGAILVLSEAGYRFRAVAGTSAGAIAASLVASLTASGRQMVDLKKYMDSLVFTDFMPEGKIHGWLDRHGGKVGGELSDASILTHRMGLYPGSYLQEWLGPILHDDLGIRTFADLKIDPSSDPDMSLPPGEQYRLLVHTSDITRRQLARLPWDFPMYGLKPDDEDPVNAVRASMSIPFFFEPVTTTAFPADVSIPAPGGRMVDQHFEGGTVTWVDGGMLRNFPIEAFDRIDGAPPRWPTIGIKLAPLQVRFGKTEACETAMSVGKACLATMMNEWDAYDIDASTAGRTIFVDNDGLTATEFHLTSEQQESLYLNGVQAGTDFIMEMAGVGSVPRTPAAGAEVSRMRRSRRV